MAVRITDRITPEGRRLERTLRELTELQVRVGFQHGEAAEDNGADICDVAAWNEYGTEHTPSRPFLRKSVDENEGKINEFLQSKKQDIVNGASAEQILKEIGIFQKELIQEKIIEGSFVPNAPATVKRKGSDRPLIDKGRMRQSVNYKIQSKGSGD